MPEVSGDIRWQATTVFAGLIALVRLAGRWSAKGALHLPLRGPLQLWVAVGLPGGRRCRWLMPSIGCAGSFSS
ncbi:MAG: hypothetical protein INF43_02845, partial [Alphaproteobacteria bacterium]|nr:hypothetical protein [Alphaproteobacteria bacterium]